MKKNFTMLQLFSIADGRLSTTMDDVYDILGHFAGESLMTHHLPVAMSYIKEKNPKWFQDLTTQLDEIKKIHGNDFATLIDILKTVGNRFEIPQLTDEEKVEFGKYMLDNSLLLKRANKESV